MAETRRMKELKQEREMVSYYKSLVHERGYTSETFSKRLGITRPTLSKKWNDPKEFKVWEINRIVQILEPSESYERRLRGLS